MAIRSVQDKHVHVKLILRKSLKRQTKRGKRRKHANKSSKLARSLITVSLLKENTRLTHGSMVRSTTVSTKKAVQNKNKNNRKVPQTNTSDQQRIDKSETEHNNFQSLKHSQKQNLKNNIPILHAKKQNRSIKPKNYTIQSSVHSNSNTNWSMDKKLLSNVQISSLKQTSHLIPSSSHESNRKKTNFSHSKTVTISSSSNKKSLSGVIKSNKKSSVHPMNEPECSSSKKKKRRRYFYLCNLLLPLLLLMLLIAGIIIAIVIPLTMVQDVTKLVTSTTTAISTTTTVPVCTNSSHGVCSSVMYHNLNTAFSSPSMWTLESCCYIAPLMNQIQIEIAIQDDSIGYWLLDDISATQGNGELISNGGFEYNMTNWTLTVYANASSATSADSVSSSQHTGNAYLYGVSSNAPVYLKQTFPIVQGQNVLISFYWNYFPPFGGGAGTSELTVTLT